MSEIEREGENQNWKSDHDGDDDDDKKLYSYFCLINLFSILKYSFSFSLYEVIATDAKKSHLVVAELKS